jgi:hypothetical protein
MIGLVLRTLLAFAALLGVLAVSGLAQPPHLPAHLLELSR